MTLLAPSLTMGGSALVMKIANAVVIIEEQLQYLHLVGSVVHYMPLQQDAVAGWKELWAAADRVERQCAAYAVALLRWPGEEGCGGLRAACGAPLHLPLWAAAERAARLCQPQVPLYLPLRAAAERSAWLCLPRRWPRRLHRVADFAVARLLRSGFSSTWFICFVPY